MTCENRRHSGCRRLRLRCHTVKHGCAIQGWKEQQEGRKIARKKRRQETWKGNTRSHSQLKCDTQEEETCLTAKGEKSNTRNGGKKIVISSVSCHFASNVFQSIPASSRKMCLCALLFVHLSPVANRRFTIPDARDNESFTPFAHDHRLSHWA
jgi:hypothetical protein